MSGIDEAEYQKLAAAVKQAERIQENGGSPPNGMISNFIENAKQRMGVLNDEIDMSQGLSKKDKAAFTEAAIAQLVSQETRLSSAEKEAYGNFLEKDYFTRDDIEELNAFYADGGAWDKLSKKGQEEMSLRVLEGVQRGEMSLSEASPTMQQKQSEWLYQQFNDIENAHPKIQSISPQVRENFIKAYETEGAEEAAKVLDQQGSFVYVQQEHKQSATEQSDVAAAAKEDRAKNVETSDTKTLKAEKVSNNGLDSLSSLGQNPTDLLKPSSNSVELS